MDDAYAIQSALVAAKMAAGRTVIGWKIGLTSRAMQDALNIDTPDSGVLFDDMIFESGATVPAGRFIEPRIEAEIAFVTNAPLAGETLTRDDVIAATDYITPAIEILDTRILRADPRYRESTNRLRYDFRQCGQCRDLVLGKERRPIGDFDLRRVGAITFRDGIVEETGLGAGVLNDPVESVVWLARRMAEYGSRIEAGHVILSGSFIRPVECPPGTDILADFGPFGSVEIAFS